MVKGISRQVIVVRPREKAIFEQAIFILRDDLKAEGFTDEMLLKEAKKAASAGKEPPKLSRGPIWACGGAVVTALLWLITTLA